MKLVPTTQTAQITVNGVATDVEFQFRDEIPPQEWKVRFDLMDVWLKEHPTVEIIPEDDILQIYAEARKIYRSSGIFDDQVPQNDASNDETRKHNSR